MHVTRRPHGRLAVLLAACCMVLAAVFAPSAFAGSTVGSFEIDGNLVDSPAGGPIDWSTPPPNLTTFSDATGKNDDSFGLGSKELEPGGWQCISGSAPQKDDITGGQIAFRTLDNKQFVYTNYTRKGVNGDAHVDYEFSQSSIANPSCPALPNRTNGDIVITFDTDNGGATIMVRAFQWSGTATLGTFNQLDTGQQGVTYDGAVNIPNTIPGHTAGDFGEAALDLTDTIGTIACGEFSTVYMKTRSSTAINAALQDRTTTKPVQVGNCPNSALTKSVRNVSKNGSFASSATAAPGDTLEYQLVYKNTGDAAASNVDIVDTIQSGQTFLSCSQTPPCTTSGTPTQVKWHFDSIAANSTVTLTFQVKLDSTFPNGTTTIRNVSSVSDTQEGTKTSNETTTTVTSAPKSSLAKSVRNVTNNGSFGSSATASPGDTVEYKLVYTNNGTSTATNVVISDQLPSKTTFVSCSQTPPCSTTGSPVTSVSWTFASVAPGDSKTVTFQVQLDSSFPAGATNQVTNVGKVCTTEEATCTNSPPATVNVLTPSSSLAKAVRNVSKNGSFATSATAAPGETVEYKLTYTNAGPGTAHAVKISDPIPAHTKFVSCSQTPPCATDGPPVTKVSWDIGDVASGQTVAVTFQVQLDPTFPSGNNTITNVGTVCDKEEGCKDSPPVTVTVPAAPDLQLVKSADKSGTIVSGDTITYTLAYKNNGAGDATGVVIKEDVPAGTTFSGCSDNCTPGSSPTWNIGTVKAGASGSVTLTVNVGAVTGCAICNTAHISSPDENAGTAVDSNKLCLDSQASPNPDGANASGSAYGAYLNVDLPLLPKFTTTISPTSSSQKGVGSDQHSNTALPVKLPSDGSVLDAGVLTSSSSSTITRNPAEAVATSTSEVLGVKVLTVAGIPAVSADVVDAVATARASGDGSSVSSAGSTFKNLKVNGIAVNDVKPGLRIDLLPAFGLGGYVVLLDDHGTTSGPDLSTTTSGGTYKADEAVDMIHVHLDDANLLKGGKQPLDIVVGHAQAHADFPQTTLCKTAPAQEVSGHAFTASEDTDPSLLPLVANLAQIPASGGSDSRHIDSLAALTLVGAGAADSTTSGTVGATSSAATSRASVADVCVRLQGSGCTIAATTVTSQAASTAGSGSRSSTPAGSTLVGLSIMGAPPLAITPPPNTTIPIPGLATIVLNEQTCDNGGTLAANCSDGAQTGHTGLTVRAIHVILLDPAPGGFPGADVKVAEAHSDATYR